MLGEYRQPSTELPNITPKRAVQNPKSISQEEIYHGILAWTSLRYQEFEKLPWKPSKDASQNYHGIKCHSQCCQTPSAQFRQ